MHALVSCSILFLFLGEAPLGCTESRAPSLAPIITPAVYRAVAGVWEETDNPVPKGRLRKLFSWGEATIYPNWGFIFELGTAKPYIQAWGLILEVSAVRLVDNRIELDVVDIDTVGPGAFVSMTFTPASDGTAIINILRKDGSWYGEMTCERLFGPGDK